MLPPDDGTHAGMFIASLAFFIVTMLQVFVFRVIPDITGWAQIVLITLVAFVLQKLFGRRLNEYVAGILRRRSRMYLIFFVTWWLLFFIPVCIVVFLVS